MRLDRAQRTIPARLFRLTIFAASLASAVAQRVDAQGVTAGARGDSTSFVQIDSSLDLSTVLERARAASPAITQSEEALRIARSGVRVSNGAYLPSLAVSTAALRSNVLSAGSVPASGATSSGTDAYSAGLSSSLELFTGGRRDADRTRAKFELTAATASDRSQQFVVTLLAKRSFYEALRGAELLGASSSRVARAERGLRFAQDRVRAGTATKSDELRARLELTTARQQQLAARDTLQSAAYALGRVVGADGPIGARAPQSLEPEPLALSDSDVVRLAVLSAPAVESAQAMEEASSAQMRASRTLYFPDLRLTGGYNWARQTTVLGAVRPGWQVAVGTTLPLFNGFVREDAITRAEANAHVARSTALDVRRQVRSDAARHLSGLHLAEQNIALADEAVRAAQEDLRVQTERYRAGITTALEELTSQLALTQAELGRVAARYNYAITRATLEAVVGRSLAP
ncbi:MAG: outer rane efflux protein [Gemmatimonadetes bacterium]|nr:outer rane efflux protein [Gemmatimonadota bacterium]